VAHLMGTSAHRFLTDEEGQGAVEYVGIIIVVVGIIAAVALLSDDIGEAIGNGLQRIVNNFVGD
jgi:Flp pilus assembly pilin Flp